MSEITPFAGGKIDLHIRNYQMGCLTFDEWQKTKKLTAEDIKALTSGLAHVLQDAKEEAGWWLAQVKSTAEYIEAVKTVTCEMDDVVHNLFWVNRISESTVEQLKNCAKLLKDQLVPELELFESTMADQANATRAEGKVMLKRRGLYLPVAHCMHCTGEPRTYMRLADHVDALTMIEPAFRLRRRTTIEYLNKNKPLKDEISSIFRHGKAK